MKKHTPLPWGNFDCSITGPTTPSTMGPTVAEHIQKRKWLESEKGDKELYPGNWHTVVNKGDQTVAIIPTLPEMYEEGKANAELIVKAVNNYYPLLECIQNILGYIDTPIGRSKLGIKAGDPIPEWLENARKMKESLK